MVRLWIRTKLIWGSTSTQISEPAVSVNEGFNEVSSNENGTAREIFLSE